MADPDHPRRTAAGGSPSHFDERGQARMVDVGAKGETERRAVASGRVRMAEATREVLFRGAAAKGDVLAVARVAGIQAAKRTGEIVPLCHPLPLTHVRVDFAETADGIAIEAEAARLRLIADNATSLGVPSLEIVGSRAPESLDGLASPDAVFIGGGGREAGLFERCLEALKPGGRLVANAVTLAGEARLIEWRARVGGSLTRIAIERAEAIGEQTGWRPLRTVTQLAAVKR